ncbi:type III secretion inner membrane ring lipoprotein SctJ [Caballeronia sp. LP006]|uniref:type III secretion system inner membrane ring lipoprotein SctJ n=1 Tax=Caballeronia sp. LP006 TaxID=3038552 RepID=UPI002861D5B7|nr:type III secretion inner membrane ring lipoprotein SctJ [Caballeronia sp. LP006]MDR5828598.1 type III secretion inner membrane ring lipoprotein SctJ [Caballeronia sp. LP006]
MRRALILLPLVLLGACKTSLYEGLDEDQANRIVAVLSQHGVESSKERNADKTWTVSVDEDEAVTATELTGAYALPHASHANLGELFSRQGLISSPEEDHVRYVYGLTEELAATLETIDGVLVARVHIVDPQRDPLLGPPMLPSASVMVRYRSDANLEPMREKIRALVAGAVQGLTQDKVYVTLVPVMPVVTQIDLCAQTGHCPPPLADQRKVERVLIVLTVMALLLILAVWVWDSGIRALPRIRIPGVTFFRRRTRQAVPAKPQPGAAANDSSHSREDRT